uniref:Uncharacterized protein n=1 Tax=Anguilla anguilla TaxID=7936 RepID=A0A0E9SCT6_ANGAN
MVTSGLDILQEKREVTVIHTDCTNGLIQFRLKVSSEKKCIFAVLLPEVN